MHRPGVRSLPGGDVFGYYLSLALRSFRQHRGLTALIVLSIAVGIGTSMTVLTVLHVLSGDPIPTKSARLFHVQLDPEPADGYQPGSEPMDLLTRIDAETLLQQKRGLRQAMMAGGSGTVDADGSGQRPLRVPMRHTSADFFPMFDTPFVHGQAWSAEQDAGRARVAVIGPALNARLFGGGDSVGRSVRVDGHHLTIVGVLGHWDPRPAFHDLGTGRYGADDQLFLPFSTARDLDLEHRGPMHCFGREIVNAQTAHNVPCAWIQYWVELRDPAQAPAFKAYLDAYSEQQRAAGRFERPANTRLRDVMQWLDYKRIVPGDVQLQVWLALAFLLVCLINTVGLLLAKFLRRRNEIGVRRALGASRGHIFRQCLVEVGIIGGAGGALGLLLALAGLWLVRQRPAAYADMVHLDLPMLLLTFALAMVTSVLAGLLPAWQAMQIPPALQLKSQ
mgnify:CR=1 FL=1